MIREAFRDLNRLREISVVVARHGFGGVLDRARFWDILGKKVDAEAAPDVAKKSVATRFRDLLTDLGPTFVKLGQVLSTRPDLLPAAWIQELQSLQDNVPPFPSRRCTSRSSAASASRWPSCSGRSTPSRSPPPRSPRSTGRSPTRASRS